MVDTARASGLRDLTVVAIDWSGRKSTAQIHAIRAAIVHAGEVVDLWCDLTRADVIDELTALDGEVVVGFDFSFGFPAWVGGCRGVTSGVDMWQVVAEEGETWLRDCPDPFFGKPDTQRNRNVDLFRKTEIPVRAKSTLQLGGAGHVGTGSIRGMPYLTALRVAGFAVWPFDTAARRTVVEIYPAALRPHANDTSLPRRWKAAVRNNDNARDAILSALVMWEHRDELVRLPASIDPITRLEGEVWMPRSTMSPRVSRPTSP
jgi:hypothetical protein